MGVIVLFRSDNIVLSPPRLLRGFSPVRPWAAEEAEDEEDEEDEENGASFSFIRSLDCATTEDADDRLDV